jgi:hypothetical protein
MNFGSFNTIPFKPSSSFCVYMYALIYLIKSKPLRTGILKSVIKNLTGLIVILLCGFSNNDFSTNATRSSTSSWKTSKA